MKPLTILQNGSRSQDPIVTDGTIGAVIQTYRMTDLPDSTQKYPYGLTQDKQKDLAMWIASKWASTPRMLQMFEPYAVLTRCWDKNFGATNEMIQAQMETGCEIGHDFGLLSPLAFWLNYYKTKNPAHTFNDMEHWPNNTAPQQYEPAWSTTLAKLGLTPQQLNDRCATLTYNALVRLYNALGWTTTQVFMNGINGAGATRGQHWLQAADIPENYIRSIPSACHINPALEPQDFRAELTRAAKLGIGLVIINGDNLNDFSSELGKINALERHRSAIKDLTRNK